MKKVAGEGTPLGDGTRSESNLFDVPVEMCVILMGLLPRLMELGSNLQGFDP